MSYPEFRAWAIEKQEFIEDVIHDGESWLEMEGYETLSLSEIFDGDEFIVEQDTGLKDKNGKEIYEGDILLAWDKYYEVVFDSERVGFVAKRAGGLRDSFFGKYFGRYLVDHCEIIGNINENPELLEEAK